MLSPNTLLQNRYRIECLLGRGGMGAVYLAKDQRFGSKVALKESLFTRLNLRKAFEREAGLLHRLRHPALPVVMDYFTEGHGQYLIMQFIPGSDLEELLVERFERKRGPFPTDQVLQWTDRLLDVLEYLHGHQPPIVHRDIKPQNLKLTPRGEVILLDFGLAKGAATEMSQAGASLHGYSQHYAPLEQISGKGTDVRSDLYSLAATAYRLVTGEIPPDAMARRAAIASGQPDPLRPADELNRQVPAAVAAALSRALALYPDERPATAADMRRALSEASHSDLPNSSGASTIIGETQQGVEPHKLLKLLKLLKSTYAGQSMSTTASSLPPASQTSDVAVPLRWPRFKKLSQDYFVPLGRYSRPLLLRITTTTYSCYLLGKKSFEAVSKLTSTVRIIMLGILLIVSAVWYGEDMIMIRRSPQISVLPTPSVDPSKNPSPTSDEPARFEKILNYSLEMKAADGKSVRSAGDEPIATGQRFKFHFTPSRQGYLYIIAPDVSETPSTFLTAQPNPAWGVETNQIEAGADYIFPPKYDKWLTLTRGPNVVTYTIIFAATPLETPRFLAGPSRHRLTLPEQGELVELRGKFGKGALTETLSFHSIVAVPISPLLQQAPGEPILFQIELKHQPRLRGKVSGS